MGSLSSVIAPIASIGVQTAVSAGKYLLSNTDRISDLNSANDKNKQLEKTAALQKTGEFIIVAAKGE